MSIANYTSDFHDGSLISIEHKKDHIIFSMESAEVDPEEIKGNLALSINDRIKGKLHIERIKNIVENDIPYMGILKKKYEEAEIMHLQISKHICVIEILWHNYHVHPISNDYSTIMIEAEKIWWENIPDLGSPL